MWTPGATWAKGGCGWYIYSDLVYSNDDYFVGDDGDFDVHGNDKLNYRFNVNPGYYF